MGKPNYQELHTRLKKLQKIETARKQGEEAVKRRVELIELISILSTTFINLSPDETDEEITNVLKQRSDRIHYIDGTRRATELGNVRTLSVFMLGCVSLFIPLKVQTWKRGISQHLPSELKEINIIAFEQGRKEIRGIHI